MLSSQGQPTMEKGMHVAKGLIVDGRQQRAQNELWKWAKRTENIWKGVEDLEKKFDGVGWLGGPVIVAVFAAIDLLGIATKVPTPKVSDTLKSVLLQEKIYDEAEDIQSVDKWWKSLQDDADKHDVFISKTIDTKDKLNDVMGRIAAQLGRNREEYGTLFILYCHAAVEYLHATLLIVQAHAQRAAQDTPSERCEGTTQDYRNRVCDVKESYDALFDEYKKFRKEHMMVGFQEFSSYYIMGDRTSHFYFEDKFTERWIYYGEWETIVPNRATCPICAPKPPLLPFCCPISTPTSTSCRATVEVKCGCSSLYFTGNIKEWEEKQKEWYFEQVVKKTWHADMDHLFDNVLSQVIDQRPKDILRILPDGKPKWDHFDSFCVPSGENSTDPRVINLLRQKAVDAGKHVLGEEFTPKCCFSTVSSPQYEGLCVDFKVGDDTCDPDVGWKYQCSK